MLRSDHRVFRRRFTEIGRAEFRRPLLRPEVDIDETEPVGKTVPPLEIVHQAPVKIAFDGHALGRGAAEMAEMIAQEHDAIGIIDDAAGGHLVAVM